MKHIQDATRILRRSALIASTALLVSAGQARAADTIAVFGFALDNTSPADSTKEELARTQRMGRDLAAALQKSGRYTVIPLGAEAAGIAAGQDVYKCNGCELPVAKRLGAKLAAYGWVQKVSNRILNMNMVIENTQTGQHIAGGSVDIRGNTDESWDHGLKFLLEEHVFPQ